MLTASCSLLAANWPLIVPLQQQHQHEQRTLLSLARMDSHSEVKLQLFHSLSSPPSPSLSLLLSPVVNCALNCYYITQLNERRAKQGHS